MSSEDGVVAGPVAAFCARSHHQAQLAVVAASRAAWSWEGVTHAATLREHQSQTPAHQPHPGGRPQGTRQPAGNFGGLISREVKNAVINYVGEKDAALGTKALAKGAKLVNRKALDLILDFKM
jgi:hypothetical protein